MAIDSFLDFSKSTPPVSGETTDSKLGNSFHVKSFSFSVAQKGTASTGTGLGAGKAEFEDFDFTIDTQLGCAQLMKHCAAGSHFDKVVLSVRKAGGKQIVFQTYTFKSVLISSFSTSGEEESTDTVKFNFKSVFSEYKAQDDTTGDFNGKQSKGGWDLKTNGEVTSA